MKIQKSPCFRTWRFYFV